MQLLAASFGEVFGTAVLSADRHVEAQHERDASECEGHEVAEVEVRKASPEQHT